ncbi:MAG: HAD family phosphatase [Bryobacteraceae bacterium]|nr:HAD family phosphatase [Bryobacteraceae bacterium]
MIPTKAFLFDFDGVLADTEPLHWKAWHEVLAPYSPDLDWETYLRLCVGTSDVQMLNFFSEITRTPVTVDELQALYPKKRKIFEALAEAQPIVDADLVRLLAGLNGLRLGVVTSSNQLEVEPILRRAGLLEILGTVIYGNDVTHHKPHPEPYRTALGRLGVEPSEATVFEDSASGIRSASEAGCHVVTVKTPADLPGLVASEFARDQA